MTAHLFVRIYMYTCLRHVGVVMLAAVARIGRTVNLDIPVASVENHLFGKSRYTDYGRRRNRRGRIRADGHFEEEGDVHRIEAFVERHRLHIQIDGDDLHVFTLDADCVVDNRLRTVGEEHLQVGQAIFIERLFML